MDYPQQHKMTTHTVNMMNDWTNDKFSLTIQDPIEERYLPDDIVQLIIGWKELKDAEINRSKLLDEFINAYNKITDVLRLNILGLSDNQMLSRKKTLTRLQKNVIRLQAEFNDAHDVFHAARLKVS